MIAAVKADLEARLGKLKFDVLDGEVVTRTDPETGSTSVYTRYKVQVPKGNGNLSKKVFSIKVLEPILKLNPEDLQDEDYTAVPVRLKCSYLDSKNIYFSCDSLVIERKE